MVVVCRGWWRHRSWAWRWLGHRPARFHCHWRHWLPCLVFVVELLVVRLAGACLVKFCIWRLPVISVYSVLYSWLGVPVVLCHHLCRHKHHAHHHCKNHHLFHCSLILMLNLFLFLRCFFVSCLYRKGKGTKFPLQLIVPNRCRGLSYCV